MAAVSMQIPASASLIELVIPLSNCPVTEAVPLQRLWNQTHPGRIIGNYKKPIRRHQLTWSLSRSLLINLSAWVSLTVHLSAFSLSVTLSSLLKHPPLQCVNPKIYFLWAPLTGGKRTGRECCVCIWQTASSQNQPRKENQPHISTGDTVLY